MTADTSNTQTTASEGAVNIEEIIRNTEIPLAYRLAYVANSYREPLLRTVEREFGLIRPEWTVLLCLAARSGLTSTEVAEVTGQARNSISRAVKLLEKKGFIERIQDRTDRRKASMLLTDKGHRIYEDVVDLFKRREVQMLNGLTPSERLTLETLLKKMTREVGNWV